MIYGSFLLDLPGQETNCYILGCEETREALLIDVGAWRADLPAFLHTHGLKLTAILLTHGHWDHVDGLAEAIAATGAAAYSFSGDVGGCTTRVLRHGDSLCVGRTLAGRIVHTPGHTPDGISFIMPGHAFTGDALFCGSVGGTGNAEDHARQLEAIRAQLFTLPDETEVHSGHGPVTTIGVERAHNPFFV